MFYRLLSAFLDKNQACAWVTQSAATWPGPIGVSMRRRLLRCVLARTGRDLTVEYGTIFSKSTAELGDNVYVGAYCQLGDVRIGDNVLVGAWVDIPSGKNQHGAGSADGLPAAHPVEFRTLRIGDRSWIAIGSVVMADVGDDSIVGAGSVVTKPIPDRVFAAGNPARVISQRPPTSSQPQSTNARQDEQTT